ncbi:hypothetical protein HK414_01605 [Ramlibacter terrae]|uniref:NlpC/P60 domain-containing protein n=1 Tax=Ramlibacter terrae TaxID=2732511 RepID=A0ABX6P007_9BURK|nr:hypothetical protein HK414_01605 [Ramlibacter terrae]
MARVLPSFRYAASCLGIAREANVPSGWPVHYVPNLSDWQEGDLVLFEATSWLIPAAQWLKGRTRVHRKWSHAAIYVGNGEIVEAVVGQGVVVRSLWQYCQTRELMLRRLDVPTLPAANIQKIALQARALVGKPYSRQHALLGLLGLAKHPRADELYCSTTAGLAIDSATGIDLSHHQPAWQPLYPATLAGHPWLKTIDVEWRPY